MITIKRYANRKLYNTAAKKYITLDGIARLIRSGEDVHIIDHESGEDITAVTLAQIMLAREKKGRGGLPRRMLAQIIQAGEDTLTTLRRSIPVPFDLAQKVDEEIERRILALIEQEQLEPGLGQEILAKLLSESQPLQVGGPSDPEAVANILSEQGIPSREEFQSILQQIEALADEIEKLNE